MVATEERPLTVAGATEGTATAEPAGDVVELHRRHRRQGADRHRRRRGGGVRGRRWPADVGIELRRGLRPRRARLAERRLPRRRPSCGTRAATTWSATPTSTSRPATRPRPTPASSTVTCRGSPTGRRTRRSTTGAPPRPSPTPVRPGRAPRRSPSCRPRPTSCGPARLALPGRDAAGPAADQLRLGDDRRDRRHRRLGRHRRRCRHGRPGRRRADAPAPLAGLTAPPPRARWAMGRRGRTVAGVDLRPGDRARPVPDRPDL